jgi:hypothetical protein
MKLSQCKAGVWVEKIHGSVRDGISIGMIAGCSNNVPTASQTERRKPENAVVTVAWTCGNTSDIHPSNLRPYKG